MIIIMLFYLLCSIAVDFSLSSFTLTCLLARIFSVCGWRINRQWSLQMLYTSVIFIGRLHTHTHARAPYVQYFYIWLCEPEYSFTPCRSNVAMMMKMMMRYRERERKRLREEKSEFQTNWARSYHLSEQYTIKYSHKLNMWLPMRDFNSDFIFYF